MFLDKPWQSNANARLLPGHMGVFELANESGTIVYVGYAGGHSRFGLRGEIPGAMTRLAANCAPCRFRYEVTTAYLTRYQELLMAHRARTGALPAGNDPAPRLGRLSPG